MEYCRESDANTITQKYMDSILIEERIIDSVVASTETEFLGETFSSPVMMPAFSHLKNYNGRELTGLEEYSIAAKNANIYGPVSDNFAEYVMAALIRERIENEIVNKDGDIVVYVPKRYISATIGPKKINKIYFENKYDVKYIVKGED